VDRAGTADELDHVVTEEPKNETELDDRSDVGPTTAMLDAALRLRYVDELRATKFVDIVGDAHD